MLTSEPTLMKIGEIAQKSGVSIKTIRYYEELGLLKSQARTEGNFRLFPADTIMRLRFIKRLQLLGLTLEEISQCLQIVDQGQLPCADLKDKLEQQIREIENKITELMLLKQELTGLVEQWSLSSPSQTDVICPNLQV